ncbi:MAG: hypothetical protein JWR74_2825 [Polaromonas sp.]|nr:hypothetical protein [Polaromonas sp.]
MSHTATPELDKKQFTSTQAQFAKIGRSLHKVVRADDGSVSFLVRHKKQSHNFAAWHSVIGLLAQIGGAT